MTIENAIAAYETATTEAEVRAAYDAMLEWSDAPEGAEEDAIDAMLNARGIPSLTRRLTAITA
ncbi:hypothetical protein [Yoonia sp.]|uniref:hypothetical protein n=1 Tax=Yoonia sp. TaxID=2212373 RepID=UPI002E08946B|nr:hypothetical protein [Yoonia sp.]